MLVTYASLSMPLFATTKMTTVLHYVIMTSMTTGHTMLVTDVPLSMPSFAKQH